MGVSSRGSENQGKAKEVDESWKTSKGEAGGGTAREWANLMQNSKGKHRDTPKISEAPIWVKSKDLLRGVSRDNTVLILQLNASVQWVPGGSFIYPCILTIQHSLLHIVGSQETLAECLKIQTKSQAMLASVWCQFCLFLPSASELHFHPAHFSDPNK